MTVDKSFMLYHDKGIYFTPPQLKRRECRYGEKQHKNLTTPYEEWHTTHHTGSQNVATHHI